MPRSPGHVLELQSVRSRAVSTSFRGGLRSYYRPGWARLRVPSRALFPHASLVGYFEGIESERGLDRRCSDPSVAAGVPAAG